jgi:hypothetical protein
LILCAAARLLFFVGTGRRFGIDLSVPVVLEYEAVLSRPELRIPADEHDRL